MKSWYAGFCVVCLFLVTAVDLHAQDELTTVIGLCSVCHGEDGSAADFPDVPIIAGTPAAHLEEALFAYQDEARQCKNEPVMCEAANQLSEEQVAAVARYYAAKPRIASGEPYNKYLAEAGERLHNEHCGRCHVLPTDKDVEFALGIPLHGQKSAYLRYAFESYTNGNRLTLIPQMATAMAAIDPDDFEALVNYYASYAP